MPIDPLDIPDADEMAAVQDAAAPIRKRKRWWRWPLRLAVGGTLLLALFVVLLPTLLSTGPGTAFIAEQVSQQIPGRVEIDNLKLAWIKGQQLENVRLFDPQDQHVATVGRVELSDLGLIPLLRGVRDFGVISVEKAHLELDQDARGTVNLDRALGTSLFATQETPPPTTPPSPSSEPTPPATKPPAAPTTQPKTPGRGLPDDLRLQFALRDVEVNMAGPDVPDVDMVLSEATFDVDGPAVLGFTLDATVSQGPDRGRTHMVGKMTDLFDAAGQLTLSNATFDVEGEVENLPMAAMDRITAGRDRLQTLIGPALDAKLSMQGQAAELVGLLTVTSEKLNVRQGLSVVNNRLVAAEESSATLRVTPDSWAYLAGVSGAAEKTRLAETFRLGLGLREFNAPRDGQTLDFASTTLGVALELLETDAIVLEVPDQGVVRIENALAQLTSPAADRRYVFALTAEVDAMGQAGRVVAGVDVRRGASGWDTAEADMQLRSLPVNVIEAWLGQGKRLSGTLGESITMTGRARADGQGGVTLRAEIEKASPAFDAPGLVGKITGSYAADGTVSLQSPEGIMLTLTPEALEQWLMPVAQAADVGPSVGLSLPQASTMMLTFDTQLALRGGAGGGFDPSRSNVKAQLMLPDTQFNDEWYHRTFPLRNGSVTLTSDRFAGPITAAVSFETDAAEAGGTAGRLSADLSIEKLWDDAGVWQTDRAVVDADVSLERLPTSVFDALTRQSGYAVAAFGQRLTASLTAEDLSLVRGGPVEFDVSSESGTVGSLPGRITPEGELVLESPSTFSLNVTPELGRLLKFANPVVLPAVASARVPITLTIDNDEFRLPLRGFDWDGFNADLTVLMGEVTIRPDVSPLDKILSPLENFRLISEDKTSLANVSPVTLNIRQGKIGYERMRVTIDEVELDFSGTINLATQTVDMQMALGGSAFAKSDGLDQLIGTVVPIGGSVAQPAVQIDAFISNVARSFLGAPANDGGPTDLGSLLGDLFKNEAQRQREKLRETEADFEPGEVEPASDTQDQELTPEQAIGGLLGELLNRELRRAQEKRERESSESEE